MVRTPSGTIRNDGSNISLVLIREFNHPPETVWAALTESDQSAQWIASWTGEPGVGNTIQVTMVFEEDAGSEPGTITACTPPRHLGLEWAVAESTWTVNITLEGSDSGTTLTFVQALSEGVEAEYVGPGWEYYLDRMVAYMESKPFVEWDEYFPEMCAFYKNQQHST